MAVEAYFRDVTKKVWDDKVLRVRVRAALVTHFLKKTKMPEDTEFAIEFSNHEVPGTEGKLIQVKATIRWE